MLSLPLISMPTLPAVSKVGKKVREWLLSFEMVISIVAISVFWHIEMSSQNVFWVAVVSLLAYISWKLREACDALWWVSSSCQTIGEKASHLEMRQMYLNEFGHEMIRQMMTYFQTYESRISDIYWFLDKLQSEMCALRLASLRRGQQVSIHFEALAFRYISTRIQRGYQRNEPDYKTARKAYENWNRFSAWIEGEGRANNEVQRMLGQADPLRRAETTSEIEQQVVDSDGLTYLWSFGKQ